MRKWPIMIIVIKILIWIDHERKEFQNDGRGEEWMKIELFLLHINDSINQFISLS